jgi:CheY-like chemotaxis protein
MLAYAGRASLKNEATDFRPVLHDMVALVRASHSKKANIVVEPMPEPLWVGIDPAQLSQVALNLLTNAAEAIGDDAGTITLRAARGTPPSQPGRDAAASHGWVHLQVRDTGSGISEEVRRRIFDPFFSTKAAGRGLGLSAVTGIIRSTHGVIDVQSVPGRETTFDVWFPAVAAPGASEGPSASPANSKRHGTILIVDDEAALRRICRRTLEPVGYTVYEAEDGLAGIDAFRAHGNEVDLVVLDLTMPRMGGAEVLQILRAERPGLPVVIASGYDRGERNRDLPNDANTRFLQKPFATTALLASVTGLLD